MGKPASAVASNGCQKVDLGGSIEPSKMAADGADEAPIDHDPLELIETDLIARAIIDGPTLAHQAKNSSAAR
jgi:hypothetical protein